MPPKKRRIAPPAREKPGIAHEFLKDNYKTRGDDVLKNGHVLLFHLDNQRSVIKTLDYAKDILGDKFMICRYHVTSLVKRSVDKYRNLKNNVEMMKLSLICSDDFSPSGHLDQHHDEQSDVNSNTPNAKPDSEERSLDPVTPGGSSDTPLAVPLPVTPGPTPKVPENPGPSGIGRTRGQYLTPQKKLMKKRIDFLSSSSRKYQLELKKVKSKLRLPKKVINQAVKRKQSIIDKNKMEIETLKRKMATSSLAMELQAIKQRLASEKVKHKKSLQYNRKVRATYVSRAEYDKLYRKLFERDNTIRELENEMLILQERVEEFCPDHKEETDGPKTHKYSSDMRMKVFNCITNQVPTGNITTLLKQLSKRYGIVEEVPHRNTVELMARELGAIAELQTAETILENSDTTLGFDATTQEGVHVNSIHITTETSCVAAAVDQLPGGTAEDYAQHIDQTIGNLSETFAYFNEADVQDTKEQIISNITNTMSDRCSANQAALRKVSEKWGKGFNELNCHLHPLDSIASASRTALKKLEESRGKLFGKDCMAANIILGINKLRYKDGKGDPRGFIDFLNKKKLPRGLIPRYRGNRLHVLFKIAGILVEHLDLFLDLLKSGTSCGGLRAGILEDLRADTAQIELVVLGLLGKYLTGPWMQMFYTSAQNEINHVEAIELVKQVVAALKEVSENPLQLLTSDKDMFGRTLSGDSTLGKLQELGSDVNQTKLNGMLKATILATLGVLERQYSKYFAMDVTEQLKKETMSARCHNIDAEELMGMFSAAQKRAPNATLCFLSSRMRAKKNRTVTYLDSLDSERRDLILGKAVTLGRKQRNCRRQKQKDLAKELVRRQDNKQQERNEAKRRDLERKLKKGEVVSVLECFPDVSDSVRSKLTEILEGSVVGYYIVQVWYEDGELVSYNGKVEKLKKANCKYKVAYWNKSEDYKDAVDYDISMYSLAVDLLYGDLAF